MEHAFQTCAHCGTLNFEGKKTCSCCKLRLPDNSVTNPRHSFRHWNTVIIGTVLFAIGLMLAAALIIDPY